MSYFAVDIETVSHFRNDEHEDVYYEMNKNKILKDKDKVKENRIKVLADAALRPVSGKVVVIGMQYGLTKKIFVLKPEVDLEDPLGEYTVFETEKDLLEAFWKEIDEAYGNGLTIVSFNGKEFDFPFLLVRSIVNLVPPPELKYDLLINKYKHNPHLDLRSFFDKGGLNELAYVLDLAEFSENGGNLPKLWKEEPLKVIRKNEEDLSKIIKLADRIAPWITQKLIMY